MLPLELENSNAMMPLLVVGVGSAPLYDKTPAFSSTSKAEGLVLVCAGTVCWFKFDNVGWKDDKQDRK